MLDNTLLADAFRLLATAKYMYSFYENDTRFSRCNFSKNFDNALVAAGLQLTARDFVYAEADVSAMMLAAGFKADDILLQQKKILDAPFERHAFKHAASPAFIFFEKSNPFPAGFATGTAYALRHLKTKNASVFLKEDKPLVLVCININDSIVSSDLIEAMQEALFNRLPVIYFLQYATSKEEKPPAIDIAQLTRLHEVKLEDPSFEDAFGITEHAFNYVRNEQKPALILNYAATSSDVTEQKNSLSKFKKYLGQSGFTESFINSAEASARKTTDEVLKAFKEVNITSDINNTDSITPAKRREVSLQLQHLQSQTTMLSAVEQSVEELLTASEEIILFKEDTIATGTGFLQLKNEEQPQAKINIISGKLHSAIKAVAGLNFTALKPVFFLKESYDLMETLSLLAVKNYYNNQLQNAFCIIFLWINKDSKKSIEAALLSFQNIKICYPSKPSDIPALIQAAYNMNAAVIMLMHEDIFNLNMLPEQNANNAFKDSFFGKASIVLQAKEECIKKGESICVLTYGIAVSYIISAASEFKNQIEIIDLITLNPVDEQLIFSRVKTHGKCVIITGEPSQNSFGEMLAQRVNYACFRQLDTPVRNKSILNELQAAGQDTLPVNEKVVEALVQTFSLLLSE